MINVRLYQAVFTNKCLMFSAEFRGDLFRMCFTKYWRYFSLRFLYLFFNVLIRREFDRFYTFIIWIMIWVTKWAVELLFYDKFLALTFDHMGFDTLTTSNFTTTYQIDRFSKFEIEELVAERTFQDRWFDRLHNQYFKYFFSLIT